ncbi:hypothetical protein PFISCL1PPCAC_12406, partial [Pristionchus fissidentatus]
VQQLQQQPEPVKGDESSGGGAPVGSSSVLLIDQPSPTSSSTHTLAGAGKGSFSTFSSPHPSASSIHTAEAINSDTEQATQEDDDDVDETPQPSPILSSPPSHSPSQPQSQYSVDVTQQSSPTLTPPTQSIVSTPLSVTLTGTANAAVAADVATQASGYACDACRKAKEPPNLITEKERQQLEVEADIKLT